MPGPADLPAPPRRPRFRKVSCPLMSSNGDLVGRGGRAVAGLGCLPGQHQDTAPGMSSPACLLPFQSHALSSSPLGSSAPSAAPERSSVSSQTGHGTCGLHLLGLGGGCDATETLLAEGRFWGLHLSSRSLSALHPLPTAPRNLPGPKPCGPGLPGRPARGHRLHRVCPRLLPWPQPQVCSAAACGQ